MSQSLYELVALGARYVFAGLMLLIVLRAWRITLIDARRAAMLRRLSPQTGLSGELVVLEGDGRARRGMRYPVIREGMIGSSRRADIRIRSGSVRRRHAGFQMTEDGLKIRTTAGAAMTDAFDRPVQTLTLPDGSEFTLGRVRLLLVLAGMPESAPRRRHPYRETPQAEDFSGPDPDDLFGVRPGPHRPDRSGGTVDDFRTDDLFGPEDGEDW